MNKNIKSNINKIREKNKNISKIKNRNITKKYKNKIKGTNKNINKTKKKQKGGMLDYCTKKYIENNFEVTFIKRGLLEKQYGGEYNENHESLDRDSLVNNLQKQYEKYIKQYNEFLK